MTSTMESIRFAGVDDEWNGRSYRVTISAVVEANSPEEAQLIAGQLLAGLPTGQGHEAHPLTGIGSWSCGKTVELVEGYADTDYPYDY
jgi:hypothetical protein